MDEKRMLERSKDFLNDIKYSYEMEKDLNIIDKDIEMVAWLIEQAEKTKRMNIAIAEMNRVKEILVESLNEEGKKEFEELGWKQTLIAELSIYEKYLKILNG